MLSELTGTANFDDRTHHVLYGTIHAVIIYFNSGCTLFNALSYRYYDDFKMGLKIFEHATEGLSEHFKGPAVIFTGHPSLELGQVSKSPKSIFL